MPPDKKQFQDLTTATLRSLAGKDVSVSYTGSLSADSLQGHNSREAVLPDMELQDFAARQVLRGVSDLKALRLRYHDSKLHKKNAPSDQNARDIYDALERARCESLGEQSMEGVRRNLYDLLDQKCRSQGHDAAHAREDTSLSDGLYVVAKKILGGSVLPDSAEMLSNLWEDWAQERMTDADWQKLKGALQNQMEFSSVARQLAKQLSSGVSSPRSVQDDDPEQQENSQEGAGDNDSPDGGGGDDSQDNNGAQTSSGAAELTEGDMDGASDPWDFFSDDEGMDFAEGGQDGEAPGGASGDLRRDSKDGLRSARSTYTAYTREFDEIVAASDLADYEELALLRKKLDGQLAHMQATITRLAHKLQRKLLAKQNRTWEFDQEEGMLDASRLSRIVANPNVPLSYKQEREAPFKDTIVSLLIDNSGSMRGRPIATAAICTDVLARTLERCAVRVEILGFTTRNWKGGQSRDLWIQNGRPANPGRLNDLRHIIYKNADEPWRKAQKNLGLMLKEGILKENIDGEALAWAYNRLAKRREDRKILIIISDGAPVDDSTLSTNPANILEKDLRDVIDKIERRPDIELSAIGIGHDVTRYYRNSMKISDADGLAKALADNLEKLFEKA
ncbi:MAG: cobaltochelatase subunit CobT [Rhodospirillales bacterium]|nr:cobaltochelatase subunit CobT [Rhodospirillales bacterium]